MVFTAVDYPMWTFEWLEDNGLLASSMKDQILILKQELRFLRTYLTLMGKLEAHCSGSSSLSCNVEASLAEVSQELTSACCTLLLNTDTMETVDQVICRMLKKVHSCRPEIAETYTILFEKPLEFNYPKTLLKDLIDCVLDNLRDLLDSKDVEVSIKEKLEILQQHLAFRRSLMQLFANPWNAERHFGRFSYCFGATKRAGILIASLSYLFWAGYKDEIMSCEPDVKLSDLLQNTMIPCASYLVQIFIAILKTSKQIKGSNEFACFSNFLQENPADSIRDEVESVCKKLVHELYHNTFLLHSHRIGEEVVGRNDIQDSCALWSGDAKSYWWSKESRAALREAASSLIQLKEVNLVLSRMIQILKPIESETFLLSPPCSEDNLVVSMKDTIRTLLDELKSLGTKVTKETRKIQISTQVEIVTNEVRTLLCSVHENKLADETVTKMNLALYILLPKIELIKAEWYLTELQNHKVNLVSLVKDEVESLLEGLSFLTAFLMDTIDLKATVEDWLLLLKHIKAVASDVSSFVDPLLHVYEPTEDVICELKLSLSWLVQKIKFIKAEIIFVELPNDKNGLTGNMKDKVENLQRELRFLRTFLMDPPKKNKEYGELIFRRSSLLANQVASLILQMYDNWTKEGIALEVNPLISELLEKIVLFKGEIKRVYIRVLPSLQSNYPMVAVPVFISSLSENMRKLLNGKAISVASVKHHIEIMYAELELVKSFLMENLKQHIDHVEVKDLWNCITDVAYKTEYVIDSFVGDDLFWYFMLWISISMEEIKVIKRKIMELCEDNEIDIEDHSFAKSSHLPPSDANVVGLKYEALMIIHQLTGGTKMRDIIAIVGMPGLGKKALAEKVYNDTSTVNFFDSRIWYHVEQEYDHRRALIFISGHTDVSIPNYTFTRLYDIEESLYYYFMERRYLIVIEGWCISAWQKLQRAFPDCGNGSRLLFIC